MNEILLHVSVIAAVGLCVALIFWLVRRRQAARLREVQALADRRGWRLEPFREPLAWGLRLHGPGWTLEASSRSHGLEHAPGSVDVAMCTRWRASIGGSRLLIGARRPGVDPAALGGGLGAGVLELLVGPEVAGLRAVEAGSAALRQRFLLWAESTADLEELLAPELQAALLAWSGPSPLIRRDREGLEIELAGAHLSDASALDALASLGEALAAAAEKANRPAPR